MSEPEKLLLSPSEAAALAGVSRTTLDAWSHRQGFPVIRNGRIVRIHLELFKLWLEAEAGRTNAPPIRLPWAPDVGSLIPPARQRR